MNVDRLRAQTRGEHEAVEATVPLMQQDLTREQYAAVLRRMYSVVHGWEVWAEKHVPAQYQSLVKERRRSHLMLEDLGYLNAELVHGDSVEGVQAEAVGARLNACLHMEGKEHPVSPATFLGAMYVMEGSTLGSQHIAKHVEQQLELPAGRGDAYFRGYGDRTGSMWRSFKEHLVALPEETTDEVMAAARCMFSAFGAAMASAVLADPDLR